MVPGWDELCILQLAEAEALAERGEAGCRRATAGVRAWAQATLLCCLEGCCQAGVPHAASQPSSRPSVLHARLSPSFPTPPQAPPDLHPNAAGKAVLSTYPLGYSGDGAAASCPDPATAPATLLCARGFEADGERGRGAGAWSRQGAGPPQRAGGVGSKGAPRWLPYDRPEEVLSLPVCQRASGENDGQ